METHTDDQVLADACTREVPASNFSLFIYGSASYAPGAARDIDLVAVTSDYADTRLVTLRPADTSYSKPTNLYIISAPTFLSDVTTLVYGGYYAHKFLFAFRELFRVGSGVDAPRLLWENELRHLVQHGAYTAELEHNIRMVHQRVLLYRPTVARAMAKYLRNTAAVARLLEYVGAVANSFDCLGGSHWAEDAATDNRERAFWRFWAEYAKHKTGGEVSHEIVYRKMRSSLTDIDTALAASYTRLAG